VPELNEDIPPLGRVGRVATAAASTAAAGVSWMALVAATTMGLGQLHQVRAEVTGDLTNVDAGAGRYRLIVQAYARDSVGRGLPDVRERPLASAQRAVTPEELSRGIAIDVLRVDDAVNSAGSEVIVAWVERGEPDLEFDGAEARPTAAALYGVSEPRVVGSARVLLKARV